MSAGKPAPAAIEALNDKELEVLRLLAGGHTVKSIAAQLGRTEAAINERLRDARRKTSTGSSRELARILDAQKVWDRTIDPSRPAPALDPSAQPRSAERKWSGGILAMILVLAAAAVLIYVVPRLKHQTEPTVTARPAALTNLQLVGDWALDVMRVPAEERPGKVTISFRVAQDQMWTVVVKITDPGGKVRLAEAKAALDGAAVPISGNMTFIDSGALRQPAPGTLVLTLGKNGAPVSTRVYTVSKDGKSMTETIIWAGTSVPKLETNYFNRVN